MEGFRIAAPHFVAGGELVDGKCTRAAPIIGYMKGWTEGRIIFHCEEKGWELELPSGD